MMTAPRCFLKHSYKVWLKASTHISAVFSLVFIFCAKRLTNSFFLTFSGISILNDLYHNSAIIIFACPTFYAVNIAGVAVVFSAGVGIKRQKSARQSFIVKYERAFFRIARPRCARIAKIIRIAQDLWNFNLTNRAFLRFHLLTK